MSVHDVDKPVDLDEVEKVASSPGPYPWTFARDVRLLVAEARKARTPRAECRGRVHVEAGGYDDRCRCGAMRRR